MDNCKTCKHWENSTQSTFGTCGAISHDVKDETGDHNSVLDEPAYTVDGSGYFAELRTKADFGCTLWEGK